MQDVSSEGGPGGVGGGGVCGDLWGGGVEVEGGGVLGLVFFRCVGRRCLNFSQAIFKVYIRHR